MALPPAQTDSRASLSPPPPEVAAELARATARWSELRRELEEIARALAPRHGGRAAGLDRARRAP